MIIPPDPKTGPFGIPESGARSDAASAAGARAHEAERAKLRQLAQEFEAMLLNEMLSGWRRSLIDDDENEPGGLATATDMATTEFGRALSRSGGLGLAAVLERAFARQQDARVPPRGEAGDGSGDAVTRRADAVPSGAVSLPDVDRVTRSSVQRRAEPSMQSIVDVTRNAIESAPARPEAVPGTVTSAYGWRRDPFTGHAKFHAGVDVRMAYGQSVSSAATGRVSFSGSQGGYGLTVVVDHDNGMQTRYAHLSSTDVRAGDQVQRGQTIARAGSSGRATGPHLHVEVLRDGRPVDPGMLLKGMAGDADWEAYRSPSIRGLE